MPTSVSLDVNGRAVARSWSMTRHAAALCVYGINLELKGPRFGCGLGQWAPVPCF